MRKNRWIIMLLLAAMLTNYASCGSGQPADDSTASAGESDTSASTDFYDTLNIAGLQGKNYTILCRTDQKDECFAETENGDVVNDAVYQRNQRVCERLGVTLEIVDVAGKWADKDNFINHITSTILSGDDAYQLVAGYMNYMPTLILENHFQDINTLPGINLENPWWTDGFTENVTIHGRMYAAIGDFCTTSLKYAESMFVNRDLLDQYQYSVDELYDTVRAGKWTFDKMTEMGKKVTADLNGDGVMDETDLHGIGINYAGIRTFADSFGINYTKRDSDGLPEIDLYSERFVSAYEDVYNSIHTDWWYASENESSDAKQVQKFRNGLTLIHAGYLGSTSKRLRDMEQSFAVIPMPKYEESQDSYRTLVGDAASILMVPVTAQDKELCGAMMECLNYESYNLVTPAYFESALQVKYARDEDSQEMMEIIRESIRFDFGYIFAGLIGGKINSIMENAMKTPDIASIWASNIGIMKANLDSLLEFFRE